MKRFFLGILCLLTCLSSGAYDFKHLDTGDGLSGNTVRTIIQDSRGFMWFGTTAGLNRYDGYEFLVINRTFDKSETPVSNIILEIHEVPKSYFWLKTPNGWIIFDPYKSRFISDMRPLMESIGSKGLPSHIIVDEEGYSWIIVDEEGIYRYKEGEEVRYMGFAQYGFPLRGITSACESADNVYFVYETGSIIALNKKTAEAEWGTLLVAKSRESQKPEIFSIFADSDNYLWVYSIDGFWIFDIENSRIRDDISSKLINGDSQDFIHDIIQDKEGRIWIAKEKSGILIYDKKTEEKTFLKSDKHDRRSLSHNTIYCLQEDSSGTIWVGTYKAGVSYYHKDSYYFTSVECGDITCIEQESDNVLLMGTNDEGVYRWEVFSDKYVPLRGTEKIEKPVVSLQKSSDGSLYVGTFDGGLYHVKGGRCRHISASQKGLGSPHVWALEEDDKGRLWIGCLDAGVQMYDPQTKVFKTFDMSNTDLVDNHISSLHLRGDLLAIGTTNRGVALMDINTFEVSDLSGLMLSNRDINHVFIDSRGLLWIGTGRGLNIYDIENSELLDVKLSAFIDDEFITSISEDNIGNIWVATTNNLVNMQIDEVDYNFSYKVYDKLDGLSSGTFNQRSSCTLDDGRIAIGTMEGFSIFEPEKIGINDYLPRVMFSSLEVYNERIIVGKEYDGRVILTRPLNAVVKVRLGPDQKMFTISLATDNYIHTEKVSYKYRLAGFDKAWRDLPLGERKLTYTNLAPGNYELEVVAVNSDGFVGEHSASLQIKIDPPLMLSWWAYVLYLIVVLGIIYLIHRVLTRRNQEKLQLARIEQEVVKTEELNNLKFKFFTNVSHELRTPLTLIISPLEGMIEEEDDDVKKGKLQLMYRNAQRLLLLVNQLLDFRKGEVDKHKLNLLEGDIVPFIEGVCNSFLLMAEGKNIQFSFFSFADSFMMAFDADKISKVLTNLLSNAFKFTPSEGRVSLTVDNITSGEEEMLEIKVSDTGVGISDSNKLHIFDRFFQVEDSKGLSGAGSGIGLSLVKDFVTLHDGDVQVYDNVGSGCVFVVQMPIRHVEARADESQVEVQIENNRPAQEEDAGKHTVLVADDSADFREYMAFSLSKDFNVVFAENGLEAWEYICQTPPDLVVSDVMMPKMDGFRLCSKIKSGKSTELIPVILLTARNAEEARMEGLKAGADEYIAKPFNMDILRMRMQKLISLSQMNKVIQNTIEPTPSNIEITSMDEKLIRKASKYVEDNMSRSDLSVEELSKELGMSRVHLYKKLLAITGRTPIEFIRIMRLKRAAQLLRESQMNVSEIAYMVGFNNAKYFSRYFKEEFGMLPSIYQETNEITKTR